MGRGAPEKLKRKKRKGDVGEVKNFGLNVIKRTL